jgi:hypothetical protein
MLDIIGGAEGDRTPGLRIANAALCQTELLPHFKTQAFLSYPVRELRACGTDENTVSSFQFQVLGSADFANYTRGINGGLRFVA